ncbi:hypothetical protein X831_gp106 [Pseudomonas phage PAK_P2]|uniref:Uncharacterized protein n=2 Tax=Pakpunavirus TaxID=1921407 RepID=V5JWJ9_9CAUD|nr:hypothetical protein X831_gp106 [Pseudomonas phage PAK_P2]YP_009287317.1 hypothetical protein BIZ94_gp021 [Pseudomonas phage vB_PaeM_MAG1]AGR89226.1 hypothetical protein PAK_P200105 [Pseudomonas phage PAK_P2]ALA12001.1 hypothetical protein vB_PaeM_MAG1_021 [Pseudomonas phage vB_PaeM_MAG1]
MTASYSAEKRGQRWAVTRTEFGFRGERVTVLGFCVNQAHALKTVAKFKAWQAQGWPYTLKDDRK